MKALLQNPVLNLTVPSFRLVANIEALSWAGLLIGMYFKYLVASQAHLGETLVTIFGTIHGALVVVYVALALLTALRLQWSWKTVALSVAATIPPFATVLFDWWAHRTGRYEPAGRS